MGRQWNTIIESLGPLTGGSMSISANLTDIEALLTTLQADIVDGIIVSSGTVQSNLRDGSGNLITSTTSGTNRRLDVMLSSAGTTGSAVPTMANLYAGTDGTNLRGISVDTSGRANVNLNNQVSTTTTATAAGNSATNTDLIASTDVGGFAEVSIQFTGTFPTSATVTPQISNDNSTFVNCTVQTVTGNTTGGGNTITALGMWRVTLLGARYFRLRVTAASGAGTYSYAYSFNPRLTIPTTQSTIYSGTQAVQGSATGTPLPVRPSNGAATVTAGTTSATPSTSAQALASNTSRQYLLIQNISDTDMYFNFGASATTSHLLVKSGGAGISFESGFVPTDAVNVICASASKSYYILSA
jgi:hypothetical protein